MSASLDVTGLGPLAAQHDALFVDVWGVVHDGVTPHDSAIDALTRFRAERGPVVLISNSPQTSTDVAKHLFRMGAPDTAWDRILTAGDIARAEIIQREAQRIHHVGPEHYLSVLDGINYERTPPEAAEIVLCTGLREDRTEDAGTYRDEFEHLASLGLDMVCANPDLVVEVGGELFPCAGQLAAVYEAVGGRVIRAGKPGTPIYDAAFTWLAQHTSKDITPDNVLAIGDGLPTDLPGAHQAGIGLIFVTGGIHREMLMPGGKIDPSACETALAPFGDTVRGIAPGLVW